MKIKPQTAVISSVLFVVAGIAVSMALGWWQTESDKIPQRLETVTAAGVETAYDPADIRGSYTLTEISSLFDIPLDELAAAFAIEQDKAAAFKVKELETIYTDPQSEVGTSSMRPSTGEYMVLYEKPSEASFPPAPAVQILRDKAELTPEQEAYLDTHTLDARE